MVKWYDFYVEVSDVDDDMENATAFKLMWE